MKQYSFNFVALCAALCLGGCLFAFLTACEHAHSWRDGHGWSREFVEEMSDPDRAEAELDRRMVDPAPRAQDKAIALANSIGCITCHGETDEPDMHAGRELAIGCIDCHGGDATIKSPLAAPGIPDGKRPITDHAYLEAMAAAHVQPRNPLAWYGNKHLQSGRTFGEHADHHGDPAHLHGSRNPENTYALLNQESPEFIRFINPGDLRVASFACGECHPKEVAKVGHSMMAHGVQLWTAALYNNGAIPNKIPSYGESYSAFGIPQRLQGVIEFKGRTMSTRWPTKKEMAEDGVVPYLDPLPVWNIAQPGNVLRIFERGSKLPVPGGPTPNPNPLEPGNPNPLVEGGRPDKGLGPRGLGTLLRTDPVFLGIQKTRLLDPILFLLGTNDHPGDFRHSGCTACHTPYANDRDVFHSGSLAQFGHMGKTATVDPTIPKNESGHPISHVLTSAIPTSQCITCHVHPGTSFANTYLGYMWWDNESDGMHMYPTTSRKLTAEEEWRALRRNPEGAQLKGLWGDLHPNATSHAGEPAGEHFLAKIGEPRDSQVDPLDNEGNPTQSTPGSKPTFNDKLDHNQFADFHGHGWVFRAVHKKDRRGNLLDAGGNPIDPNDPDKWHKAVHLRDIHLERGMHCVDCHFEQDVHGDGKLYGEVRNAVEITCIDCHGTYYRRATLRTSGPNAPEKGTDLTKSRVGPKKLTRFRIDRETGKIYQRSQLNPDVEWEVVQTVDTIDPDSEWSQANPEAARHSRRAKTVQRDGVTWGNLPNDAAHSKLAHNEKDVACYTCHTSWMTSCFGCHLPMEANSRTPMLHNESLYTRNYTRYNYQVLRDDIFMIGKDTPVKGAKTVPVRSSSAVIVSSQNANREWVYHQQQTVSSEGYSGQAFNPHFPHATSGQGTTKMCSDCHVSRENDNNAWMAQLLLQGTNFVNFLGRYVYVATGKAGLEAVIATEHDEPQAVIGSHLHSLAYPEDYKKFVDGGRDLKQFFLLQNQYHHSAGLGGEILDLQLRGEYLYAARGSRGFHVYDVANIDNKGFSERITTAPVSPLGQDLGFDTRYCVDVESPSTLAVDPARTRLSSDPSKPRAIGLDPQQPWHVNQEQQIHPIYAYLYIGDREEGLILTFAGTLLDGDPANNFLKRAEFEDGTKAFNPNGLLNGLTSLTLAGHHLYVTCDAGLVVLDMDNPLSPQVIAQVQSLHQPRHVAVQFRYAFVTDAEGLKVIDVTDPAQPRVVNGATVPLTDAHRVYVARTYAFVAAGSQGLAIVDVTQPESPRLDQLFNADGKMTDTRDVKVGMTNATLYAYVADGKQGIKVLELTGPHLTPQFRGFAPPLSPRVIAHYHTHGPALAISKGLDRDRAVDETGHQIAVFGRLGARPLNQDEMHRMYIRDGEVWTVTDEPDTEPQAFTYEEPDKKKAAPQRRGPGAAPSSSGPRRPGAAPSEPAKPAPRRPGAR